LNSPEYEEYEARKRLEPHLRQLKQTHVTDFPTKKSRMIRWMAAKSQSPVENGGKDPIILFGFQPSKIGDAGFR
jgi:hypothetical protein